MHATLSTPLRNFATRNGFLVTLGAAQTAAPFTVVPKRARMSNSHWSICAEFLDNLHIENP
jgi:hypothetical protein